MLILLLIFFIAVPITEIAIFIEVGAKIGIWPTLGMVLLTAILGSILVRHQGFQILKRVRYSISQGVMPVSEVFTALCLLVAGAFLLTPGFLTDSFGLMLLIPSFRLFLTKIIIRSLSRHFRIKEMVGAEIDPSANCRNYKFKDKNTVINGDFEEIKDNPGGHNNDINSSWRI